MSYDVGATVRYDPTGQQDFSASQEAHVTAVQDQGDGTFMYTIVTISRTTGHPVASAPITDVPEAYLFVAAAPPGPGNDQ